MPETKYTFALGQMPADADGWRPQALIILDNKTHEKIARIPYDLAAELLIAAITLAHSVRRGG